MDGLARSVVMGCKRMQMLEFGCSPFSILAVNEFTVPAGLKKATAPAASTQDVKYVFVHNSRCNALLKTRHWPTEASFVPSPVNFVPQVCYSKVITIQSGATLRIISSEASPSHPSQARCALDERRPCGQPVPKIKRIEGLQRA